MEFKTELHCHCREISLCADVDTDTVAKKYLEAGYSTVVLTNHFNRDTIRGLGPETYENFIEQYIGAAEKLKKSVDGRIHVLLGMEIRFETNWNDYLVYGVTPEFLREHTEILDLGLRDFRRLANQNGMLLFQAHPFRFGMTTTNPEDLDGVEAYNGHPGHNSNNDIACAWAKKYKLLTCAGSDYHHNVHVPTSGILTNCEIQTQEQLIEVLKSQCFTVIR